MSLFALLATWGNFLNSRRAFLAATYSKIRAELKLLSRDHLPVCDIYNESDRITANDIRIEISIFNWMELEVFRGRRFTYTHEKLARLRPLESCVPSGLSSDEIIEWFDERGYESLPLITLGGQSVLSRISLQKSYTVRLVVTYTSNIFGADKTCKIVKKYKLIPCSNPRAIDSRDQFYWRLCE